MRPWFLFVAVPVCFLSVSHCMGASKASTAAAKYDTYHYGELAPIFANDLAAATKLLDKRPDILGKPTKSGLPVLCELLQGQHVSKAMVQLLIDRGADVNARDYRGMTPLAYAASQGIPDIANLLIAKGAGINTTDNHGTTPLMLAVKDPLISVGKDRKSIETVRLLLDKGADVNAQDNDGWTPMMHAVSGWGTTPEIIKILIDEGADVNKRDKAGCTPLMRGVGRSPEMLDLLIKSGADINAADNSGYTPLLWSVDQGRGYEPIKAVEILIRRKADVNAKSKEGATALSVAAMQDSRDLVAVLMANGADINVKDTNGDTALVCVSRGICNKEVVAEMIGRGADVKATGRRGLTALHVARDTRVVNQLIAAGASVNAKDEDGRTPMHYAILNAASGAETELYENAEIIAISPYDSEEEQKKAEAKLTPEDEKPILRRQSSIAYCKAWIKSLAAKGGDPAAKDNLGRTPLHYAVGSILAELCTRCPDNRAEEGGSYLDNEAEGSLMISPTVTEALITLGSDVNAADSYGRTPIYYATGIDTGKMLLSKGASVKVRDKDGRLPLHFAIVKAAESEVTFFGEDVGDSEDRVARAYAKWLTLLAPAGVDINAQDSFGRTPLHYVAGFPSLSMTLCCAEGENAAGQSRNPAHLVRSVLSESESVIKLLIAMGASVNVKDSAGKTPLFYVSDSGTAKLLLDKGADVMVVDKDGCTLLHVLTQIDRPRLNGERFELSQWDEPVKLAKLFIARGVDVNAKDGTGHSALYYARQHSNWDLAALLEASGAKMEESL